jgi:hypothetical protein
MLDNVVLPRAGRRTEGCLDNLAPKAQRLALGSGCTNPVALGEFALDRIRVRARRGSPDPAGTRPQVSRNFVETRAQQR